MPKQQMGSNRYLSEQHTNSTNLNLEWDQSNQQWWDWYVSLAENDAETMNQPLLSLKEPEVLTPPTEQQLYVDLTQPYSLDPRQIEFFRTNGYVKLKDVLSPEALSLLRVEMQREFRRAGDALGTKFGSLEMMWQENTIIKTFVWSRRLARIAAELLGVHAVRLYHDNGLSKEPGCGRTPWHYDDHHFPIATHNVCTVWVPLQRVPLEMGPLGFAKGIDVHKLVEDVPFNKFDTSYDRRIIERFRERNVEVDESPFEIGEISFHHNFNFHTAASNRTSVSRMVLATTYFEDGAHVIDTPHLVNGDWRKFMPGVEPGELIDTLLNPILYSQEDEAIPS